MKNTVKKILALVFVVAMVCSLAVPVFAAFESFNVKVYVVDDMGNQVASQTVKVEKADKANVLEVLKKADYDNADVKFTIKNNVLTAVADTKDPAKETYIKSDDVFETASWIVSVNGKPVNGDLATASVAKDNKIVVYWADATIGTKLIDFSASNLSTKGVISFFYYDAEGVKQPLVGAKIKVKTADGFYIDNKLAAEEGVQIFVTDEKGQIWIAPEYLAVPAGKEKIEYVASYIVVDPIDRVTEADGYTKEEADYINEYRTYTLLKTLINGNSNKVENWKKATVKANAYDVAGATGDMNVVYVMVAAAAVITLGAVVIMKKKSVKDN